MAGQMGKRLEALLGRGLKSGRRMKTLLTLSLSRLSLLINRRRVQCSQARSDVLRLLCLSLHHPALLRAEHVIREQNMLDALLILQGYCHHLIHHIDLLEHHQCPDELEEGVTGLIYASSRCTDFPELREIRAIFASRFGKEFVGRAIELHHDSGMKPMIIQKLSTRPPSLENKMKVLKEIASQNGTALRLPEPPSTLDDDQGPKQEPKQPLQSQGDGSSPCTKPPGSGSMDETIEERRISGSVDTRKYRDAADAAKAAFESAAYAAAAARAAVRLSRSESHDLDENRTNRFC